MFERIARCDEGHAQETSDVEGDVGDQGKGGKPPASCAAGQGTASLARYPVVRHCAPVHRDGDGLQATLTDATLEASAAVGPKSPLDDVTWPGTVGDHATNL